MKIPVSEHSKNFQIHVKSENYKDCEFNFFLIYNAFQRVLRKEENKEAQGVKKQRGYNSDA